MFGECTGSSESEEETVAHLLAGNRLKRQLSQNNIPAQAPPNQKVIADTSVEINEDWYSSGSERERKQPTPPNEREPTTPIYSDEDENDESKSESFGDVSSEGSAYCPPQKKAKHTQKKKREVTKKATCEVKNPETNIKYKKENRKGNLYSRCSGSGR